MSVTQTIANRNSIATNPSAGSRRRTIGHRSNAAAYTSPAPIQAASEPKLLPTRREFFTSEDHSQSTIDAAKVHNTTNGRPPTHATRIAIGASTADEIT